MSIKSNSLFLKEQQEQKSKIPNPAKIDLEQPWHIFQLSGRKWKNISWKILFGEKISPDSAYW